MERPLQCRALSTCPCCRSGETRRHESDQPGQNRRLRGLRQHRAGVPPRRRRPRVSPGEASRPGPGGAVRPAGGAAAPLRRGAEQTAPDDPQRFHPVEVQGEWAGRGRRGPGRGPLSAAGDTLHLPGRPPRPRSGDRSSTQSQVRAPTNDGNRGSKVSLLQNVTFNAIDVVWLQMTGRSTLVLFCLQRRQNSFSNVVSIEFLVATGPCAAFLLLTWLRVFTSSLFLFLASLQLSQRRSKMVVFLATQSSVEFHATLLTQTLQKCTLGEEEEGVRTLGEKEEGVRTLGEEEEGVRTLGRGRVPWGGGGRGAYPGGGGGRGAYPGQGKGTLGRRRKGCVSWRGRGAYPAGGVARTEADAGRMYTRGQGPWESCSKKGCASWDRKGKGCVSRGTGTCVTCSDVAPRTCAEANVERDTSWILLSPAAGSDVPAARRHGAEGSNPRLRRVLQGGVRRAALYGMLSSSLTPLFLSLLSSLTPLFSHSSLLSVFGEFCRAASGVLPCTVCSPLSLLSSLTPLFSLSSESSAGRCQGCCSVRCALLLSHSSPLSLLSSLSPGRRLSRPGPAPGSLDRAVRPSRLTHGLHPPRGAHCARRGPREGAAVPRARRGPVRQRPQQAQHQVCAQTFDAHARKSYARARNNLRLRSGKRLCEAQTRRISVVACSSEANDEKWPLLLAHFENLGLCCWLQLQTRLKTDKCSCWKYDSSPKCSVRNACRQCCCWRYVFLLSSQSAGDEDGRRAADAARRGQNRKLAAHVQGQFRFRPGGVGGEGGRGEEGRGVGWRGSGWGVEMADTGISRITSAFLGRGRGHPPKVPRAF